MLRIVLIRPGSTDYDEQDRIQGALDIPLSAGGVTEVSRIVEELRDKQIELIYAPSYEPARQTARTLAEGLGIKQKRIERMQNLDHGLWQGMCVSDVRRKQPKVYRQWQEQPENVCPPDGEMLSQAQERVRAAMSKLLRRHKEGVIALVLPEPLASLVRHFIKQDELGDLWKAIGGHGCWEVLEVEPAKSLALSS